MEKVWFSTPRGEKLAALFHADEDSWGTTVLLTHGFRGTKEGGGKALEFAEHLIMRGYGVFLFDFCGAGESEGDFSSITLSRQVEDVSAALDWLEQRVRGAIVGVGRSFGGSTLLKATASDFRLRGLVLWSTPLDLKRTFQELLGELFIRLQEGHPVRVRDHHGGEFELKPDFAQDLLKHDLYQELEHIKGRPILFLHGARDEVVTISQAKKGYNYAFPPKEIVIVPNGDHQFTTAWEKAWEAVFSWLERYFPSTSCEYVF